MLYLVEHFYSIQGEGKFAGSPSLFFRFGGCNMRCEGFACEEISPKGVKIIGCDTVYAVNKENFLETWQNINRVKELISIVKSYKLPKAVDIVMTGGEPLIYANNEIFIEFLSILNSKGHKITFETNASIDVDFNKHIVYKSCIFAMSVKLSNSKESLSKRINIDVIKNIIENASDSFFKFSINKEFISEKLEYEIDEIVKVSPKTSIFCMPLGGSKEEIEKNTQPLIEFCKKKGYSFSDRLHIRIWDNNKGV